jgi:Tfp pilus assembly protein PilF
MKQSRNAFAWAGMMALVGLFLLSGCGGGGGNKTGQAEEHFKLGAQYFADKQMEDALRELKKALELNPEHTHARYYLGSLYHTAKAYSWALKEYKELLRIDPNYPRIHTGFANLYYERGLMAWSRAVKRDQMAYWLPDTTRELPFKDKDGLFELVQEYHNKIEVDSADAETYSKLSQAYFILAGEEYEIAVKADPKDTTAQLYLGMTYSEQGYPYKAWSQHEVLKEFDPSAAELLRTILEQKEKEESDMKQAKKQGS